MAAGVPCTGFERRSRMANTSRRGCVCTPLVGRNRRSVAAGVNRRVAGSSPERGVQRPPSKETGAVSFTARGARSAPFASGGEGSALSASRWERRRPIGTGLKGDEAGQTLALSDSR